LWIIFPIRTCFQNSCLKLSSIAYSISNLYLILRHTDKPELPKTITIDALCYRKICQNHIVLPKISFAKNQFSTKTMVNPIKQNHCAFRVYSLSYAL